jgi:WD40 repeat protein
MSDPRIFVSYARTDGFALGRALGDRLARDHGLSVWRDLADLEGGGDWWRQITDAIDRVEYLILVMTPAALSSRVVRDEWRYARHRGVCVLPVLGVAGLDFSELPEWMRRTHFVDPQEPEQWIRFVRTLESPCRMTRVAMMAEPPPADFVARGHEFAALQGLLVGEARGGSVAIAAALKGAGGYGKTTLARAICHDDLIRDTYYDGILWVTLGEQPGDAAARLEDLIVTLTGTASLLASTESRKQRLTELLADRSVLIVIDDVWNAAHLQPFLVGGDRCARLITTRDSQTLPPHTIEVRVDAMHTEEAVSLLGAGVAGAERQSLAQLARHLGDWPLLLTLVNRILRDRIDHAGDTAPGAIAHVTRLLERRGFRAFDARDPLQRHDAASATLAASVLRLTPDEQARLRELVIFAEDLDIPLATVALLWNRTGGLDDVDTEACARTLFSLSLLLDFDLARRRIRLHDVIRRYLADDTDAGRSQQLHGELVEAYRATCGGVWSSSVADGYFHRFLPYHLAAAGHGAELRELLLDPSWMTAKLIHADIADVLDDYRRYSSDRATQIMADAVRLSADVLVSHPEELTAQLLGRIDGSRFPEFAPFVDAWRSRPHPAAWLCPRTASLASPGGALMQTWRVDGYHVPALPSLAMAAMTGEDVTASTRELASLVPRSPHISSDGHLVAHGAGGYVELFDTIARRDIWWVRIPDDYYPVVQVALTPDARHVAAAAGYWMEREGADAVHVWHVESKREVFAVARGGIQSFLLTSDARRVVIEMGAGVVEVWSVESGERLARWECGDIAAMTHGVESGELVVASPSGTVNVWTPGADQPRTTMAGSNERAVATAVTPDARTIVRAFADCRLECHHLTGDQLQSNILRPQVSPYYNESIQGLVIAADGRTVISQEPGAIRLWNLDAPVVEIRPAADGHGILSMTPDGRHQVVQTGNGTVACRDAMTAATVTLDGLIAPSGSPAIAPDGGWVVYQQADGRYMIWDAVTGAHVMSLTDSYRAPVITSDSRVLYLRRTAADGLGLWTLTLKPRVRLEAARRLRFEEVVPADIVAITAVSGSPTVIIVTASNAWWGPFSVFSWHPDEPAPRRVLSDDGWRSFDGVRANERWLFGWNRATGALWDLRSASTVVDLGFEEPISAAAFTISGWGLLIASGRVLTIWDIGRRLVVARFHADAVIHAVGCPSDTSFIAASSDGRVHRLDLQPEGAGRAL